MDYVVSVLERSVVVHCESEALRSNLDGAIALEPDSVALPYSGTLELAVVLTLLQSLHVPFVSAGPNPPSDVFEFLRQDGLVMGSLDLISWRGPGQPELRRTEIGDRET